MSKIKFIASAKQEQLMIVQLINFNSRFFAAKREALKKHTRSLRRGEEFN